MEFKEVLLKRRSVRAYTAKKVTTEQIHTLLTAAINAPSACNMQSWHFYVVTDPDIRAKFSEFSAAWVASAPVIFVVCTDDEAIKERFGERAKLFPIQDTALAIENLLLSAADMGLNGCFIGAFDHDKCRAALDIPEKYGIMALIPMGEPQVETPRRERKPIAEVVEFVGETEGDSDTETADEPFALKGASLPNAVFDDLNLAGASFNNINMAGVRFSDINMAGANFGGLCLDGASFGCVDMKNAKFDNPDLHGTTFQHCSLSGVAVIDCTLDGMTIDGINVSEALEFYKANKK